MIGYLKGLAISVNIADSVRTVLEIGGVGYIVYAPRKDFEGVKVGDLLEFWISEVIREDSQTLYGFVRDSDRKLFDQLTSVSGIGPKIALLLLSNLGATGIEEAVFNDDVKKLASTPGLGNKGASKIILDLKGKLVVSSDSDGPNTDPQKSNAHETLVNAIVSLGFKQNSAKEQAARVALLFDGGITNENLPHALKAALAGL